jgi:hypothetical protein
MAMLDYQSPDGRPPRWYQRYFGRVAIFAVCYTIAAAAYGISGGESSPLRELPYFPMPLIVQDPRQAIPAFLRPVISKVACALMLILANGVMWGLAIVGIWHGVAARRRASRSHD